MDYTNFTTIELEEMLKSHKEKLINMLLTSGLEAITERIKEIEFTIAQRKNDNEGT